MILDEKAMDELARQMARATLKDDRQPESVVVEFKPRAKFAEPPPLRRLRIA